MPLPPFSFYPTWSLWVCHLIFWLQSKSTSSTPQDTWLTHGGGLLWCYCALLSLSLSLSQIYRVHKCYRTALTPPWPPTLTSSSTFSVGRSVATATPSSRGGWGHSHTSQATYEELKREILKPVFPVSLECLCFLSVYVYSPKLFLVIIWTLWDQH